jgi:class 3 adenylate cyclase
MTKPLQEIDQLLAKYFEEAAEGIVDEVPSRLLRGQGTEKNFYIFKIDLFNSTMLLRRKRPATYLKLAHTFLSAVDQITINYGADPDQTEYAGDSVLAYFPAYVGAEQVLRAACLCRAAVVRISQLPGAVGELAPKCKTVIHYAPLIMAKIGPRSGSVLSAIGYPIHKVAKLEKKIGADKGWATKEFYNQVSPRYRKLLIPQYIQREEPVWVTVAPEPAIDPRARLATMLYPNILPAPPRTRLEHKTVYEIDGYLLDWTNLNIETGLVRP